MACTAASMAPRASLPERNTSCPSRTGSRASASTWYLPGAVNSAARKRMALEPTSMPPTRSGNGGGAWSADWAFGTGQQLDHRHAQGLGIAPGWQAQGADRGAAVTG